MKICEKLKKSATYNVNYMCYYLLETKIILSYTIKREEQRGNTYMISRIGEAREKLGMSQEQLARMVLCQDLAQNKMRSSAN